MAKRNPAGKLKSLAESRPEGAQDIPDAKAPDAKAPGAKAPGAMAPGAMADVTGKVGRVISVSGSQVIALLEADETPGAAGSPESLQIGALVKMRTPETMVFGMVSGLSIPIPAQSSDAVEMRIVELELVGEVADGSGDEDVTFRRGVSFCPALGDAVYAVNQFDLKCVYARPNVSCADVGTIYQDRSLPALISIDDLLGKHFAILGTTGTGKSCAVAKILRAILERHGEGHVLLLDIHNEYSEAFKDCAEILGHDTLKLPYWLLNFEELQQIVIENAENREEDRAILKDAVVYAKRAFNDDEIGNRRNGADSPVPYRMSDLIRRIEESLGRLDKPTDSAPYLRLRDRIGTLQTDSRFAFMFQEGITVNDDMVDIVSRLFRVPAYGKPVTVLDLSETPSDILNVVVSLLCRLTFDFALWAERDVPILLVCEEAHRYAAEDGDMGFNLTQRALSRIAREGRKYGVSLCIVSQRPSELAVGILSQCNTVFAMRMTNQKDQEFVRGMLSESAVGLMNSLPSLRTGEAIAVGEGVSVPVRLSFASLPPSQRPLNGTARFSDAWNVSNSKEGYVAEIIHRWRRQRR